MTPERKLHLAICKYVDAQYKGTVFTTESSGLSFTMGFNALLARLRSSPSLPDLWIMKPKVRSDGKVYCGLLLEIKTVRSNVYRKDGSLKRSEHIEDQNDMIIQLIRLGYYACFVCGFDEAKKVIDWYMKMENYKI